jgi:hypothetical protein
MNSEITELLEKEPVGLISILLDKRPYSAAVHFSHRLNPLKIFVQTSNDTNKAKPFLDGSTGPASMVVGFSEQDWLTLQMSGSARAITNPDELKNIYKIHYAKHPNAEQYKGPDTLFLEFTPTWWRYTDFNSNPETIYQKGDLFS